MLRFCQGQMAVPEWFNRNLNGIHVTQKVVYIYTHTLEISVPQTWLHAKTLGISLPQTLLQAKSLGISFPQTWLQAKSLGISFPQTWLQAKTLGISGYFNLSVSHSPLGSVLGRRSGYNRLVVLSGKLH